MKKLPFLLIVLFLFALVFIKSNAWDARVVEEFRDGEVYLVTKHSIYWDRFFDYIKNAPRRISEDISSLIKR